MQRLVGLVFVAWLAVMAVGVVIALLPVLVFIAGFVGVLLLFAFMGRLVAGLF